MRCTQGLAASVLGAFGLLLGLHGSAAYADRPRDLVIPIHHDPAAVPPPAAVNSHTIFLNQCTGGCAVKQGSSDDARTDTSSIVRMSGTVTAYSYGGNSWNTVVTCVTKIMSPFNITVVTTRPASGDYFEI